MRGCKISESKTQTQVSRAAIRMKSKKSLNNKKKQEEQDVKLNDTLIGSENGI